MAIIGKKFEGQTDKKEQWYGTDYKIESIPQATLEVRPTGLFFVSLIFCFPGFAVFNFTKLFLLTYPRIH